MTAIHDLLGLHFLGNTLLDWGLASLAFAFTFLVLPLARGSIRARQAAWADGSHAPALELLSLLVARTSRLLLLIVALYLAEKILTLPRRVDQVFNVVIIVGIWLQVGIWATIALRFFILQRQRRSGVNDAASKSSVDVLMFCAQLIIWAVLVLLALDNLGVNITALVAGLGVGGIAVALAVQTILGDLFGSLSIAFDKPFAVGDTLRIDDYEGVVEHIGIKSTRMRSVSGEQIILSNADVLKSRVRNLGRMPERRVLFKLLVTYETEPAKVEQISAIVQKIITSQAHTRFVNCLLGSLGVYALEFDVVYFVTNQPSVDHPRTVDAVNRAIVREFAATGIQLAYPTRRIRLDRDEADDPVKP